MFFRARRRSKTTVLERDLSEAGSRAMETIGDLAEHALSAAREAGQVAAPAVHHSAEALGKAFEKAAEALSEAGGRFARTDAGHAARLRIADASERLAESIRPKKRHHRIRNLLIASAVVGGVVALVQSPLRGKVTERLFGPSPDEEPESIQLPGSDSYDQDPIGSGGDTGSSFSTTTVSGETGTSETQEESAEVDSDGAPGGNGVPSTQSGLESQV